MIARHVVSLGMGLVVGLTAWTGARAEFITNDTYLDSYNPTPFYPAEKANTDFNYGGSAAVKVVSSGSSDSFPLAPSAVRTLFTLPDFWTALGDGNVISAVVTFRIRNNNNNVPFTRSVGIYPLLHAFTAGTGFQPTVPNGTIPNTMGGTENTPGNPVGADWLTSDGAALWTTPGGDYDSADGVTGVLNVGAVTTMSWDITSLINNIGTSQDTRKEIHDFGLVLKITDDLNFPAVGAQQFLSFYSYEGALTQGSPDAFKPVFTFILAPEPASMGILAAGMAGLVLARKRGRI